MAYEQKPNTGSLFKNDRKEQDSHPDYKGTALIDGLGECWLDAWLNTSANGTKYMSLKIKPKEARQGDRYTSPDAKQASYTPANLLSRPELVEALGWFSINIGSNKDFFATRTAYKLDLRGPAVGVQTGSMAPCGRITGIEGMVLAGSIARNAVHVEVGP